MVPPGSRAEPFATWTARVSDVRTVPSISPWISALPIALPLVRLMTAMGVTHWLADSFQVESRWMASSVPSGSVTALPLAGLFLLGKDGLRA